MSDICCVKGIGAIIGILNRVEGIAKETPPTSNAVSRFGNPAFKVFYDRVHDVCSILLWGCAQFSYLVPQASTSLHEGLPNLPSDAIQEVSVYFNEAWGNRTRIDYGSGMELSFLCWLYVHLISRSWSVSMEFTN